MAKKNSSKTATKEALQASEPRMQTFTGWQGVNFKESPLGWHWGEKQTYDGHNYRHHQSDLKPNYLLIQNNVETTDSLTLETRFDSEVIATPPTDWKFFVTPGDEGTSGRSGECKFTGVSCLYYRWLFCVFKSEFQIGSDTKTVYSVGYHDITDHSDPSKWTRVHLMNAVDSNEEPTHSPAGTNIEKDPLGYEISEIGYYEQRLIALTSHKTKEDDPDDPGYKKYVGEIFTAEIKHHDNPDRRIDPDIPDDAMTVSDLASVKFVPNPKDAPADQAMRLEARGQVSRPTYSGGLVDGVYLTTRVTIYYSYVNRYGNTLPSDAAVIYTEFSPVTWTSAKYLNIKGTLDRSKYQDVEITGVDLYCTLDDNVDAIFIGHVQFKDDSYLSQTDWEYNWYGAMTDVSQWMNTQLTVPTENNTKGVTAKYFNVHDSRIYFWGDPERPYRLWVGGNPGSELSVSRGLGGSWVDIEPGSGIVIHGTQKWKTTSGANIITMLCGNPNTNRVKRFNLVETAVTVTNEIVTKGYMYEEVSNVVGCNSRWGHGVFGDGLYCVNRYGLMLTTMAMEYNAQMRNQQISDVIQPIFTERLAKRLNDARLVHIDEVVYIILSEEPDHNEKDQTESHDRDTQSLDRVILCYDLKAQAWYTFTHDGADELLLHAMPIDSEEHEEGLGIISENAVYLYPTTGVQPTVSPKFDVLIETGELAARTPIQSTFYLCQLELRFDYFIGDAKVVIEGVDYYGRDFTIEKKLNRFKYGRKEDGSYGPDNAEMRSWVEWIRVDKLVESYRVQIKGKARFRLTHVNVKAYAGSNKIGLPYGFDAGDSFVNRHRNKESIHHYIKDYNNLRRAIVT